MDGFNIKFFRKTSHFRRLTGVHPQKFRIMVEKLRKAWDKKVVSGKKVSGRPWKLKNLTNHFVMLLILYRTDLTQEALAVFLKIDPSTVCRSLKRIETVAVEVLGIRKNKKLSSAETEELIVDCTEQPVQRPKKRQKEWYSGKKKRHTIKTEVVISPEGEILYTSKSYKGKTHDLNIRRRSEKMPDTARLYGDSAYQGYEIDHKKLEYPYKKQKDKHLTEEEKEYNTAISKLRIKVENIIGDMKTFRILQNRYRYNRRGYNQKFRIIAGIVNISNGF
jgi:hypothetical protein